MSSRKSLVKSDRRGVRWLLLAASMIALLGCASKEFSYVATVAGGEQMKFTINNGAPVHAKSDGFEVLDTALRPDFEAKKVFYGFRFSDAANGKLLQSVRVEDVTDSVAVLLVEDAQPKLEDRTWMGKTPLMAGDDPSLKWVSYVNDSVRIYRFTLTLRDGRKVVLHQPTMVPAWVKKTMRTMFGENY